MRNSCIVNQRFTNNIPNKFNVIIPPQDIKINPDCLERLAAGNSEAYEWVYKNYCRKVYDYAMLMTRNEAISEDVVQETFLKVWQHREKLRAIENFNSYLFILYRNYIRDVLKGQQKEISVRHEYYRDSAIPEITVDDTIDYKETQQLIARAVKQLPQQRQLIYKLVREQGWKRQEIAKELQIAPNTVKAQMQKTLRFLIKKLSEL